jgi:hypothetical protein
MYAVESEEWVDGLPTLPSLQEMKDSHTPTEEE